MDRDKIDKTYDWCISDSFGECDSYGTCSHLCPADASCNIECKPDQQCKYADWVFSRTSKYIINYKFDKIHKKNYILTLLRQLLFCEKTFFRFFIGYFGW